MEKGGDTDREVGRMCASCCLSLPACWLRCRRTALGTGSEAEHTSLVSGLPGYAPRERVRHRGQTSNRVARLFNQFDITTENVTGPKVRLIGNAIAYVGYP